MVTHALPVYGVADTLRAPPDARAAMVYESGWTFREIDAEFGVRKGTAFRAFKRSVELDPRTDFERLDNREDAARIESLKTAGRLYPTTINAVVLSQSGYDKLRTRLESATD